MTEYNESEIKNTYFFKGITIYNMNQEHSGIRENITNQ